MHLLRDLHAATLAGAFVTISFAGVFQAATSVRADEANHASLNPLAEYDKSKLTRFVEAPLFDATRRLPPPVAAPVVFTTSAPVAAPPEPPPSLHLLGVINGKAPVAMVSGGAAGKTELLHTGDRIGDWSVEVLPVGLRLRNGMRAFDYTLFKTNGSAGPMPVQPPSALASAQIPGAPGRPPN